jgi:hypothetical protein
LPQVSNRPDAYTIRTVGVRDAEYILFSRSIRGEDINRIRPVLEDKRYGIVAEVGEFVLAKKGHPTDKNADVLKRLSPVSKPAKPKPKPKPKASAEPAPEPAPAPTDPLRPPDPDKVDP